MEEYKPISCDYYDELEALAIMKKKVEIIFVAENGGKSIVLGRITELYTRDHVEYMKLDSGLEIRLDSLIEVDGKKRAHFA
jgi:Rho-binding antiterminator